MAENAPRPAGWGPDRAAGINRQQHQSLDTRSPPHPQQSHAQRDLADRGFRDPVQQPRRSLLKRVYRLGVIAFLPSKLDQHRRPSADRWRLACFTRVTSSILGTFTGRTFPSLSAPTQGKIGLRPWPLTLRPPRSASPVRTPTPSGTGARQRIEWHSGTFADVLILDSAAE